MAVRAEFFEGVDWEPYLLPLSFKISLEELAILYYLSNDKQLPEDLTNGVLISKLFVYFL